MGERGVSCQCTEEQKRENDASRSSKSSPSEDELSRCESENDREEEPGVVVPVVGLRMRSSDQLLSQKRFVTRREKERGRTHITLSIRMRPNPE